MLSQIPLVSMHVRQALLLRKSRNMIPTLNLMSLGVKQGNEIEVQVSGGAEEANAAALEAFLKANL